MNSKLVQAAQLVLFCTCLTFAIFEFALHFRITGYILVCLAVALLVLLAPLAAKWKVGPSGIEFERMVEEREKAEEAAAAASKAELSSLLYYRIFRTMTGLVGTHPTSLKGLEDWLKNATTTPQTLGDLRHALGWKEPAPVAFIAEALEDAGFIQQADAATLSFRVKPDMVSVIQIALPGSVSPKHIERNAS